MFGQFILNLAFLYTKIFHKNPLDNHDVPRWQNAYIWTFRGKGASLNSHQTHFSVYNNVMQSKKVKKSIKSDDLWPSHHDLWKSVPRWQYPFFRDFAPSNRYNGLPDTFFIKYKAILLALSDLISLFRGWMWLKPIFVPFLVHVPRWRCNTFVENPSKWHTYPFIRQFNKKKQS